MDALVVLLSVCGGLWLLPDCAKRMEAKKAKVRQYMEYARARGTLMANNNLSGGVAPSRSKDLLAEQTKGAEQ